MTRKPYVLAVKAIVRDGQGRILLLKRGAESRLFAGKWDVPGGKVDSGEAFDEALVREVREETGLAVSLEGVAGATEFELPKARVAVLFLEARCEEGDVALSPEHDAHQWARPDEVGDVDLSDELGEFLRGYLRG